MKKLGEGGMGVVYTARDTHLDRFVAIKVLSPEKIVGPGRKRFTQEAKAASALNHPNIITIHDVDEADGVHFSGSMRRFKSGIRFRFGLRFRIRSAPLGSALRGAVEPLWPVAIAASDEQIRILPAMPFVIFASDRNLRNPAAADIEVAEGSRRDFQGLTR